MLERARRKTAIRLVSAAALCGLLLASQQASAAEDPKNPGLPAPTGSQYAAAASSGINQVARAKQWFQLPRFAFAADVHNPRAPLSSDCSQPFRTKTLYTNRLYSRSPEGAPKPWGYFPPITVRTVAFGAIPVEATINISQLRDAEDLPVPLISTQVLGAYFRPLLPPTGCGANAPAEQGEFRFDSPLTGQVNVRVTDLRIDDVAVDVGNICGTVEPADISLTGKGYHADPLHLGTPPQDVGPLPPDPNSKVYSVLKGGLFTGTIDIPTFAGCRSGNDDLSPLLTGMVSGPDNPMSARQSPISTCMPPTATCPSQPAPFPYPERDDS